jgi:hypothetical protein
MTVSAGAPLARINGLDTVWLEAAIPEAQAALVNVGGKLEADFAAYLAKNSQARSLPFCRRATPTAVPSGFAPSCPIAMAN